MRGEPTCPRCAGPVQPPGPWSSRWTCALHGAVAPLQPVRTPSVEVARHVQSSSRLPVWLLWPLPHAWVLTGLTDAGDEATGVRATVAVLSGPNPLGGPGDLVVVAEEAGVGLGAGLAGLPGPDPGPAASGPAHAKITVSGHPTALWAIDAPPDRAVYVGESRGLWLWLVLWPQSAGALLLEDLALADLRELGGEVEVLPYGAPPAWLVER